MVTFPVPAGKLVLPELASAVLVSSLDPPASTADCLVAVW